MLNKTNLVRFFFVFFIVLFSWASIFSGIDSYKLDNGLQVILLDQDDKPEVSSIQVWYKVGSKDDPEDKTGMAHFCEHMMFRGSKQFPADKYSKNIGAWGGRLNAHTSYDKTVYHVDIASRYIPQILEMEADRMYNLTLSANVFEMERSVVLEERLWRVEDQAIPFFVEQFNQKMFDDHPYAHPILGYEDHIKKISLADMKIFYKKFYVPHKTILIVVGNFSPKLVKRSINHFFSDIPGKPALPSMPAKQVIKNKKQFFKVYKQQQLPLWVTGFKVPNVYSTDFVALTFLNHLLFYGNFSLFQREIVDVYSEIVDSSGAYDGWRLGNSLFYIYAFPKDQKNVSFSEEKIYSFLKKIKRKGFDSKHIQAVKNKLKANYIFALDSNAGLAKQIGTLALFNLPINFYSQLMKKFSMMSNKELLRVYRKYINFNYRTTGYLL